MYRQSYRQNQNSRRAFLQDQNQSQSLSSSQFGYDEGQYLPNQQPEDTSIYHHTRRQLGEELRRRDFRQQQPTVLPNLVPIQIKRGLSEMWDQPKNYDFWFSCSYDLWNKYKKLSYSGKAMRRCCYLRLQCEYCTDGEQRQRRWTTSGGTLQIQWMKIPLQLFCEKQRIPYNTSILNFPYIIIFRHKVYTMKCRQCLQWGNVSIYQSVMDAFTHLFCRIIAQILNNIPQRNQRNGQKGGGGRNGPNPYEPILPNHEYDLCQACEKGVCLVRKNLKVEVINVVYFEDYPTIESDLCYHCTCTYQTYSKEIVLRKNNRVIQCELCEDCIRLLQSGDRKVMRDIQRGNNGNQQESD